MPETSEVSRGDVIEGKIPIIIPPDLELPDLGKFKGDEEDRSFNLDFIFQFKGNNYVCKIDGWSNCDLDSADQSVGRNDLASFRFRIYNSSDAKVSEFRGSIYRTRVSMDNSQPMRPRSYLNMDFRMVEEAYRHNGLGELSMINFEEFMRKISKKYPQIALERIELNTRLTSVGRLIVDEEWMKNNGLGSLGSKGDRNLGYVPKHNQTERAVELLTGEGGAESVNSSSKIFDDVGFYKML